MTNPDYIIKTFTFAGETPDNLEVCEIEMRNHAGGWTGLAFDVVNDTAVDITFRAELGTAAVGSGSGVFAYMIEPDHTEANQLEVVTAGGHKIVSLVLGAGVAGLPQPGVNSVPALNCGVIWLLASSAEVTGLVTFHLYRGCA